MVYIFKRNVTPQQNFTFKTTKYWSTLKKTLASRHYLLTEQAWRTVFSAAAPVTRHETDSVSIMIWHGSKKESLPSVYNPRDAYLKEDPGERAYLEGSIVRFFV